MSATSDLLARLRRHYIKPGQDLPGGIFLPEVTLGGAGGPRADALFVGFTSSSGRLLVGHELKVSRADWRRELDKAGKADAWADQCHAWYIVAPSTDIVPVEELPPTWGLLTVNPRCTTRLTVTVKAMVNMTRTPSWEATRSILSRADTLRAAAIRQAKADARDKARAAVSDELDQLRADVNAGGRGRGDELRKLRDAWAELTEALGIDVDPNGYGWRGGAVNLDELKAAMAFVRVHRDASHAAEALGRRLGYLRDDLAKTAKELGKLDPVAALNAPPAEDGS